MTFLDTDTITLLSYDHPRVTQRLGSQFQIVPFDDDAAGIFDRLLADRRVKKVGRADLLIACIALARRATLVTHNLKDFTLVPGLAVENWAD